MTENQKDIALIDRIIKGDKSAYTLLINRHKNYAFTLCKRVLNNREDAEETAQDAFMQAFGALKDFNREAKFTTWFYRIVMNAALMQKRKQKNQQEEITENTHNQVLSYSNTSDGYKKIEQQYFINQALQKLSGDDTALITLFYLRENSLDEIGEILNISAETAKVKLHRARKRLAEKMQQIIGKEAKSLY